MTTITTSRVLVLVLAVLALAFIAPVVSAHGNDSATEPTADDAPVNGTAADWADWMEAHMNDHMGPGAAEWMESYMGISIDEMAEDMASGEFREGHRYSGMQGQGQYGGMQGQGQYGAMSGHC